MRLRPLRRCRFPGGQERKDHDELPRGHTAPGCDTPGASERRLTHVTPPVIVRGEDPAHLREEIIRAESKRAEARYLP